MKNYFFDLIFQIKNPFLSLRATLTNCLLSSDKKTLETIPTIDKLPGFYWTPHDQCQVYGPNATFYNVKIF